jgi:glucokinase
LTVLALDVGATKIAHAIVDEKLQLGEVHTALTRVDLGPNALIENLTTLCRARLKDNPSIQVISISSAGPLDPQRGQWLSPTNFLTNDRTWGTVEVTTPLSSRLNRPIFLDNDAACAALGSSALQAHRVKTLTVITLGTGVGIGTLVDGDLVRAHAQLHPEISHLPLNAEDETAICGCGRHGCIEAYISSLHFARRISEQRRTNLRTEDIVQAARQGEIWAVSAFREYAHHLAITLSLLKTLYQSEQIVIAGGLAAVADLYFEQAKSEFMAIERGLKSALPATEVIVSPYTYELSLIGAAEMARRRGTHAATAKSS